MDKTEMSETGTRTYRGPFYKHGLTLIPTSISISIHYTTWDKITSPFRTSTATPLKFGNAYVILSHTLRGMWFLIHAGIKVNTFWWRQRLHPTVPMNTKHDKDITFKPKWQWHGAIKCNHNIETQWFHVNIAFICSNSRSNSLLCQQPCVYFMLCFLYVADTNACTYLSISQ